MSTNLTIHHAIYFALCEGNRSRVTKYGYKSGLHKHHIVPMHAGGTNEESNYTYLTPIEHSFAHSLLWQMYHDPNDLRSMYMLGVNLSLEQRTIVGKWCYENQIGIHSPSVTKETRYEWSYRGYLKQKEIYQHTGDKNNFYYWSTPEGQKERASRGGRKGAAVQMEKKLGIFGLTPEERKRYGALGVHKKGTRKAVHKPGSGKFKRVKIEELDDYLNNGWVLGTGINFRRPGHPLTDASDSE